MNPADCNYLTGYQQLVDIQNKLGANSTSLFSQNGDQSTVGLFKTDAPELADDQSSLTEVPKSKALKKESDATATNDAE